MIWYRSNISEYISDNISTQRVKVKKWLEIAFLFSFFKGSTNLRVAKVSVTRNVDVVDLNFFMLVNLNRQHHMISE